MNRLSNKFSMVVTGVIAISGLALSGCSPSQDSTSQEPSAEASAEESASPESLSIGVIYLDNNSGFYAAVKKGVEQLAGEAGIDINLIEENSLQDPVREATSIDNMIAAQVDAILISAAGSESSVAAIKTAYDAGIPVVCYNTCIAEPALSEYISGYALGDNVEFGYNAGITLADELIASGVMEPSIGVVNCEFVEVCIDRKNGFERALEEKFEEFTIADSQAGGDASASLTVAQDILTANPDIDGFFGQYGDATLGAVKAVENAGRLGEIVIVGGDMNEPLADLVVDGSVSGIADISGVLSGRVGLQTVLDLIDGNEPADLVVPVPGDIYDSPESAQKWMDDNPDGIG